MQLVFQKPFKSIKALLNIELHDFTVLTGVNGSGKSHLLEAIENGSIRVKGIDPDNNSNHIRRFDWSNLVPNDVEEIKSYQLSQQRDIDWEDLSDAKRKFRLKFHKLKKELDGIIDTSDLYINKLACMEKIELEEELDAATAEHVEHLLYWFNDDFKNSHTEEHLSMRFNHSLRERLTILEKVCKAPLFFINKEKFYQKQD